ncbi:hypothetical protein [Streptomyces lydicus]|uniref:hypothetical protein n=1 Tax=Streptomyces lydicus TaxID=47763 RepID=UPI0033C6E4B8
MVETEHRVIKVVVSKPRVIKHRVDKGQLVQQPPLMVEPSAWASRSPGTSRP